MTREGLTFPTHCVSLPDMDLESYRTSENLTYRELRDRLDLKNKAGGARDESNVRRIALGQEWPGPDALVAIVQKCRGVSLVAMVARYRKAKKAKASPEETEFEPCENNEDGPQSKVAA